MLVFDLAVNGTFQQPVEMTAESNKPAEPCDLSVMMFTLHRPVTQNKTAQELLLIQPQCVESAVSL